MKKMTLALLVLAWTSSLCLADHASEKLASGRHPLANLSVVCDSGDGALRIKIRYKSDGTEVADVTTEAEGGAYPTFHYKVRREISPQVVGAPISYSGIGNDFELEIDTHLISLGRKKLPSKVRIPDLDIDQSIPCDLK